MLVSPDYSDIFDKPEMYVNRFEEYAINAFSTDEGISHTEDLIKEAVAVGATLVPVFWLTTKASKGLVQNWASENQLLFNVFVSAGLYHIICEETGINNWFLTNSVSAKKSKKKYWKVSKSASGTKVDLVKPSEDMVACKGDCSSKPTETSLLNTYSSTPVMDKLASQLDSIGKMANTRISEFATVFDHSGKNPMWKW